MTTTYLIKLSQELIRVRALEEVRNVGLVEECVLLEVLVVVARRLLLFVVDEALERADLLGGVNFAVTLHT